LNCFGQNQNLASPKTPILSPLAMDSISAAARPGEVKGQYHKERGTKIAPNFANQNCLFMGNKIRTFYSSTVSNFCL